MAAKPARCTKRCTPALMSEGSAARQSHMACTARQPESKVRKPNLTCCSLSCVLHQPMSCRQCVLAGQCPPGSADKTAPLPCCSWRSLTRAGPPLPSTMLPTRQSWSQHRRPTKSVAQGLRQRSVELLCNQVPKTHDGSPLLKQGVLQSKASSGQDCFPARACTQWPLFELPHPDAALSPSACTP